MEEFQTETLSQIIAEIGPGYQPGDKKRKVRDNKWELPFKKPSFEHLNISGSKIEKEEIPPNLEDPFNITSFEKEINPIITPGKDLIVIPNFIIQSGMITIGTSTKPGRKRMREWLDNLTVEEINEFYLSYRGEKVIIKNIALFGAVLKEYSKIKNPSFGMKEISIIDVLESAGFDKGGNQYLQLKDTLNQMANCRLINYSIYEKKIIKPIANYAFVNFFEMYPETGKILIEIGPEVGNILVKRFTKLDVNILNQLEGGLAKFQYCFIKSNPFLKFFDREKISEMVRDESFGKFSKRNYNRKFKNGLDQLLKLGVISWYKIKERESKVWLAAK